ncbi:hypothetical protein, partial [Nostoc sp. 'Peltigera malacea cyanobiont' DB3992]|uniref:hypothetical protein n=1 Tax=Nostoc sp. 'Peltigera malacea cyanobiont' DB3992 TaxID=1206980 RepID=UPI000C066C5D
WHFVELPSTKKPLGCLLLKGLVIVQVLLQVISRVERDKDPISAKVEQVFEITIFALVYLFLS